MRGCYELDRCLLLVADPRFLSGFRLALLLSPALASVAGEGIPPVTSCVILANVPAARPSLRATALRIGSSVGTFFFFCMGLLRLLNFPAWDIETKRSPGCKPGLLGYDASLRTLRKRAVDDRSIGRSDLLTLTTFFVRVILLLLLAALFAGLTTLLA